MTAMSKLALAGVCTMALATAPAFAQSSGAPTQPGTPLMINMSAMPSDMVTHIAANAGRSFMWGLSQTFRQNA